MKCVTRLRANGGRKLRKGHKRWTEYSWNFKVFLSQSLLGWFYEVRGSLVIIRSCQTREAQREPPGHLGLWLKSPALAQAHIKQIRKCSESSSGRFILSPIIYHVTARSHAAADTRLCCVSGLSALVCAFWNCTIKAFSHQAWTFVI